MPEEKEELPPKIPYDPRERGRQKELQKGEAMKIIRDLIVEDLYFSRNPDRRKCGQSSSGKGKLNTDRVWESLNASGNCFPRAVWHERHQVHCGPMRE
jgi:hypothetical protein